MAQNNIIQVKGLIVGYEGDVVLDNISFDIYEGERFVVLGESGCGKTTLLRVLIGLLSPISGQVVIDGDEISHCDEETFHRILKKFGVLYQSGALFGSMTVAENVALPIREYTDLPEKSLCDLVKMKLNLVGLGGYENYMPAEISGGMKKRAAIARAMALNPKIIFFDELSAGLDPITSAGLDNLVIQLNKSLGTTMVIVTHELQSIFTIAERVIMLDKKSRGIIAKGDPIELRDHSQNLAVRQFFNRQPTIEQD